MANKTLFSSIKALLPHAPVRNEAGGPAYALGPKHSLAQFAATGCFNGTFYADAETQLDTLKTLISNVGLAKVCHRLKIPTPPRGYWQQLRYGKSVRKIPLPKLPAGEDHKPVRFDVTDSPSESKRVLTEVDVLVRSEKLPENRIVVAEAVEAYHPIVERTSTSIRSAKTDSNGCVSPKAKGCLSVCIGPGSVDRAMRILDALVRALESRGFPVTPATARGRDPHVEVFAETLTFELIDVLDRKERPLTTAERRNHDLWPQLYSLPRPQFDHFPSGTLALRIGGAATGTRCQWRDDEKHRLEDQLNAFVAGLIRAADRVKIARREHEEQERRWEEERRRRQEEELRRREEEARIKQFEAKAIAWRAAQEFRQFIDAVRAEAVCRNGQIEDGSEVARWLDWAEQRLADINPLHDPQPLPAYSVSDDVRERWEWEIRSRGW